MISRSGSDRPPQSELVQAANAITESQPEPAAPVDEDSAFETESVETSDERARRHGSADWRSFAAAREKNGSGTKRARLSSHVPSPRTFARSKISAQCSGAKVTSFAILDSPEIAPREMSDSFSPAIAAPPSG